jgi:hypothetical protein
MFRLLRFGAMRLARMMAFGFFRRFGHRAGGDHQKREGNTERSARMHPASLLLGGIPSPGKHDHAAIPMVLDGLGGSRSVSSRIVADASGYDGEEQVELNRVKR